MNCNIVEDKLLDYIDGSLKEEEMNTIKDHLKSCDECKKEYVEMKSTIDYIKDSSSKIDTSKELNLNPNRYRKKSVRKFTRTGLIAVVLSLILVVTAFATDIFDFIKWWQKSSEREISAWEELIENGVGEKLEISVTDKDIRVTAEGIIADDISTIILLKIEDLNGNTRFTPRRDADYHEALTLGGDIPNLHEDIPPIASYHSLYAEEDNTTKLIIYTDPMEKDEGNIEIYIDRFVSMINKGKRYDVEVSGNWSMTIPVKKIKSKVYNVDEVIDLDGNELVIEKIIIAPTVTKIQYRYESYNKENRYFIDDVTFLIKDGMKTYTKSELRGITRYEDSSRFGFTYGEYDIQSLYLEDPKDIDIIVNTYRYTTRGLKKYTIDWHNLPQVIEYDNNKITIEDIKYTEDSTEIIVKEDSSWNRKYIQSNIYLKIDEVIEREHDGVEYSLRRDYTFNGVPMEYETRDSKGKVKDKEDKLWSDEFHNFVYKQKITLSKEEFERYEMKEENFEEYLIPGEIYIEGQEYIEYPNIKVNIKLQK